MAFAIETRQLVKEFGDNRAVDGVDLSVPSGRVYGVLGPNGAGKTTTIRMLATLLKPSSGLALVLGHDVVTEAGAVRSKVAMTGQFASLDEDLTGTENLVMLGRLYGFSRTQARETAPQGHEQGPRGRPKALPRRARPRPATTHPGNGGLISRS